MSDSLPTPPTLQVLHKDTILHSEVGKLGWARYVLARRPGRIIQASNPHREDYRRLLLEELDALIVAGLPAAGSMSSQFWRTLYDALEERDLLIDRGSRVIQPIWEE